MTAPKDHREQDKPRDASYWAEPVSKLKVSDLPAEAINLNVEGRKIVGPLQGFGRMWQKTYWVRLSGAEVTPTEAIKTWKENFPDFWPSGNSFFTSLTGIAPGEVAVLNLSTPGGITLSTGVMVIYADDESFTFMTPEGHMFSGWITFSAFEMDDSTVAQAQMLIRPNDPLYEIGFRLGGSKTEDKFWLQTLASLARHFEVEGQVQMTATCVDPKLQWSQAKNVWHNAAIPVGPICYGRSAPLGRKSDRALLRTGNGTPPRIMPLRDAYNAIVVGSGPNGLAAAITVAQAGRSVLVVEAKDTIGGGARSAELTLPGYVHDVCSAIHPLAIGSPFFSTLPLSEHGIEWIHPSACLAHPFDDGSAAVLERSVEATGDTLGRDASAYRRLMAPLVAHWDELVVELLGPLRRPRHPLVLARFGLRAIRSAQGLAGTLFKGERARTLFGGMAAHSFLRLDRPLSAAFGLVLGASGHALGWPIPRGGSQSISNALEGYLRSIGGEIVTGTNVESVDELPDAQAVLLDVTPRQVIRIAGGRLPAGYRRKLEDYRYGPGVFKMDWALDGPVPWKAPECARAGTVHLGGTIEEIAGSERAVWEGEHPEKPFVLLAQQSLFDPSRAPEGMHTAWAYCHVPNGSRFDMTDRIESQIERFAPGFRDRILARSVMATEQLEAYNPNYVGGDINGGVQDLRQLCTRPTLSRSPYSTPARGLYICSSSTPPGGGVHGMCGYYAARAALRRDL